MNSVPTTPWEILGAIVFVLALVVLFFIKVQGQSTRSNVVSDHSEARSDELQKQMVSLLSDVKQVVANNTDVIKDSRLYMQLLSASQEQSLKRLDIICDHISEEKGNWKVALDQLGRIEQEVK